MQPSTFDLLLSCDKHTKDVFHGIIFSNNKKSIFHIFGRNMCTVIERISANGRSHQQYMSDMDSLLTYGSALIHLQLVNNDCYYLHICTIWTSSLVDRARL